MMIKIYTVFAVTCFLLGQSSFAMIAKKEKILRIRAQEKYEPKAYEGLSSDFLPKKGDKKVIDLHSPIKKRMKILATIDNQHTMVIDNSHKDFSVGKWAWVNTIAPIATLAFDADNLLLNQIVDQFLRQDFLDSSPRQNCEFEEFLISIARLVRDNVENIDEMVIQESIEDKPVCRHFATLTAVLFSKVVSRSALKGVAHIQMVSGFVIDDKNQIEAGGGHLWNLVTWENDGQKHYWFFDVHNNCFISLIPNMPINKLIFTEFSEYPKIYTETCEEDQDYYKYLAFTIEKYLNHEQQSSLYHEDNLAQLRQITDGIAFDFRSVKLNKKPRVIKQAYVEEPAEEQKTKKRQNSNNEETKRSVRQKSS